MSTTTPHMLTGGDPIDSLVASQRPGFTLERAFYGDPNIFDREMERVFGGRYLDMMKDPKA